MLFNFEEEIRIRYGECINQRVLDQPKELASWFFDRNPAFVVYDNQSKEEAIEKAVKAVENGCYDVCPHEGVCMSKCDGC